MNVERILQLADVIEKQPHTEIWDAAGFNMADFTHDCGTPACIAGWAIDIFKPQKQSGLSETLAVALGLGIYDACGLVYAHGYDEGPLSAITPARAARTLRHLAKTGEVDWNLPEEAS